MGYLILGVVMSIHALQSGFGHAMVAGSGDPSQALFYLAWLPHAIGAGDNPLFSHDLFAPNGVNLMANTSILLPSLILSPITVLFGPVTSFNLLMLLAPATSALAAYIAIRRHVLWPPACFIGGLVYGFGPFELTDLRFGHFNLTLLAVPVLIFMALEDILVNQQRSFTHDGILLFLAIAAQFFISLEMLAICLVLSVIGVFLLALMAGRKLASHARHALGSIGVAAALSAGALAYPGWFFLDGPRHYLGPVWPFMGDLVASLRSLVLPHGETPGVGFISGGDGDYLGVVLLGVLIIAPLACRSVPMLRFSCIMGAVAVMLSLGYHLHIGNRSTAMALPGLAMEHLPLFDDLVMSRFAAFSDFFIGMAAAIVLDRLRVVHWPDGGHTYRNGSSQVSLLTAAVIVISLAPNVQGPFPVKNIYLPTAFRSSPITMLSAGSVLLEYPLPSGYDATALTYQAISGIPYRLIGGYGIVPGVDGHPSEQPGANALTELFAAAELGKLALPLDRSTLSASRLELKRLDVAAVVVRAGFVGSAGIGAALTEVLGRTATKWGHTEVWVAKDPVK